MALLLRKKGFNKVRPMEGGLDAWRERGLPLSPLSGEHAGSG